MGKFLFKSILFISCFVLAITILSVISNTYLNKNATFKLNKNINTVVFGHSHAETAYNDSLITNFKNLAQSGESYFYTHIKARQVLNQNPQIKNVFIEFSNIDITQIRDQEIWSDKYINWRYPIYSGLMNTSERFFLGLKNPKSFLKTLPKTFKKQFTRINNKHHSYNASTSGYLFIEESKLDSLLDQTVHKTIPDNSYYKESTYNLLYLDNLVALCKEKKLNIYFIRSPLYKDSFYVSNEDLFNSVKENKYKNIPFIDLKDFSLNNTDYRDLHHVNYKGAKKVSIWLNNSLQTKNYNVILNNE
jgi:hypothetical protein